MDNNSEKILKILKKEKAQKILSYWDKKSDQWIQYNELRKEFVSKYSNVKKHPYDFYVNPETMEKFSSKPKSLYNADSQLSRDLKELVNIGLLENKKTLKKKNKSNSYYRPSKKYEKEIIRIQNKTSIDNYPLEEITDFFYRYPDRYQTIYGISQELFECFSKEERNEIENILIEIDNNVKDIENVRKNVLDRLRLKRLKKIIKNTVNERVKNILLEKNLLIFEQGSLMIGPNDEDTIFDICLKKGIRVKEYLKDADAKTVCRFWSELHLSKNYNLNLKDIDEIKEIWDKNQDLMNYRQKNKQISFCRYY